MEQKEGRPKRIARIVIFFIALGALALLTVDNFRPGNTEPPAARLLPTLPSYRQVEGQTITAYVGALGEGAALLSGQPQLAVTLGVLDQVMGCYQEIGGVRGRVYSHVDRPLEAGFVAVIDESQINEPENLFRCLTPAALNLEGTDEFAIEPCTHAYSLVREEGTFHIIYAGSSHSVCRDFCTSLEQCQGHVNTIRPIVKKRLSGRFSNSNNDGVSLPVVT